METDEHTCTCCSHHAPEKMLPVFDWLRISLSAFLLVFLFFLPEKGIISLLLGITSCILAGYPSIFACIRAIVQRKLHEGLMMILAMISCFALRDYREAAAIALFYALGELLEDYATQKSRKSITALSRLRPDTANLCRADGEVERVAADDVPIGSELVVQPFERIPLDGTILRGDSTVDTSALTGESLPRSVGAGDSVSSGCVNGNGQIFLKTTALAGDSAAARLLELVENAAKQKSKSERFLTRFAKIYFPVVLVLGALVAGIPILLGGEPGLWLRRGLMILVSGCPCAIVLSVPLCFFATIGSAARQGVLIKGGRFVELFAKSKCLVLDKTGTITTDDFHIVELFATKNCSEKELLYVTAAAEQSSVHPLARAITRDVQDFPKLENFQETPGGGVRAILDGHEVLCGSRRYLEEQGVDLSDLPDGQIFTARDGAALGVIRLESNLHPQARGALKSLRRQGFERFVLLSGDEPEAVQRAAQAAELEESYAALLPEEKLEYIKKIRQTGITVYVGDGINDAPSLALADVGIAMGFGAPAASEAADMTLVSASLKPLAKIRALFLQMQRVLRLNIIFALSVKLVVIVIGFMMKQPPIWLAVFADVGVMVLTVLHSAQLIKRS